MLESLRSAEGNQSHHSGHTHGLWSSWQNQNQYIWTLDTRAYWNESLWRSPFWDAYPPTSDFFFFLVMPWPVRMRFRRHIHQLFGTVATCVIWQMSLTWVCRSEMNDWGISLIFSCCLYVRSNQSPFLSDIPCNMIYSGWLHNVYDRIDLTQASVSCRVCKSIQPLHVFSFSLI